MRKTTANNVTTPADFFSNGDKSLTITQNAANLLGISSLAGEDILVCSADELGLLSAKTRNHPITIAVYGNQPKQVYTNRKKAYQFADACLTLSEETAKRLRLLHSNVFFAATGKKALKMVTDFYYDKNYPKTECLAKPVVAPMTILFLTHNFGVGGLEQVVIDIGKLAQSNGHKAIIGYSGYIDEITKRLVEKANIEHQQLPEKSEDRKDFLRKNKITLVNAHYATILATESKELGIPYLQTIHNMYLWFDEKDIAEWKALDAMTAGYIAVSANSAMVADLRLGIPPEKITIVPNGIEKLNRDLPFPPEQDKKLRSEFNIPPEGIVFVQVASLNGVKGHAIAIEAFIEALKFRQDIYLILLGKESDPNVVKLVKDKISKNNLTKHIIMPGYREDVYSILNLSRAMLAPSFIEGWSLAISEAVQMGVPVIATDVGGASEQLEGKENIILPAFLENIESISSKNFFIALFDEEFHKKCAPRLTEAILEASSWSRRKKARAQGKVRSVESAYKIHLKIMAQLIILNSLRKETNNAK